MSIGGVENTPFYVRIRGRNQNSYHGSARAHVILFGVTDSRTTFPLNLGAKINDAQVLVVFDVFSVLNVARCFRANRNNDQLR